MQDLEWAPENRRDDIRTGLQATFSTSSISQVRPIRGGVSGALIFQLQVRGRLYALRIEPPRIELKDRRRGFACMSAAADAGAAPRVHYADPVSGIAVMDFIGAEPLSSFPGGPLQLARAFGGLSAKIKAAEPFPYLGNYPELISANLEALQNSPLLPPGALAPHAEGLELIAASLPWDQAALASSHNDPNPRNLLFDGERLWLVDWELGFLNDPLVDAAIFTLDHGEAPELETALLEASLGRAVSQAVRARFKLIRLLTRLFYGGVVLTSLTGSFRAPPAADFATFTPQSFRAKVAKGELASGTPETAYAFALMSLGAFLSRLQTAEIIQALNVVKSS